MIGSLRTKVWFYICFQLVYDVRQFPHISELKECSVKLSELTSLFKRFHQNDPLSKSCGQSIERPGVKIILTKDNEYWEIL